MFFRENRDRKYICKVEYFDVVEWKDGMCAFSFDDPSQVMNCKYIKLNTTSIPVVRKTATRKDKSQDEEQAYREVGNHTTLIITSIQRTQTHPRL